jgi:hypothetical protein
MAIDKLAALLRAAHGLLLGQVLLVSFRRTVATVVRDDLGPALAQQQLSHSKLSTTEAHYLQRHTHGPDVRNTLDRFASGHLADESIRKVSSGPDSGGVSEPV